MNYCTRTYDKPLCNKCFAHLWKDGESAYRVTVEDLFRGRFWAEDDDAAINRFLNEDFSSLFA